MNNSTTLTCWAIDLEDSFCQTQSIYFATEEVAKQAAFFLKKHEKMSYALEPYKAAICVYDTYSEFLEEYEELAD